MASHEAAGRRVASGHHSAHGSDFSGSEAKTGFFLTQSVEACRSSDPTMSDPVASWLKALPCRRRSDALSHVTLEGVTKVEHQILPVEQAL